MAYPVLKAPYGLIPVNLVGGQVYAGGVRHIPIKSGEAKAIANGDPVGIAADGTIKLILGTAAMKTQVGVFVGCHWEEDKCGFVNSNRYPGGIISDSIYAVVVDDPSIVMKVAVVEAGASAGDAPVTGHLVAGKWVPVTVDRDVVGKNIGAKSIESTLAHGRSNLGAIGTAAVTATLPFRIVDVVEETSPEAGKYTELLVKWNIHAYVVPAAPQAT